MIIKYSIVIPTRNRAQYLKYAIESVLASDRTDIELIVSNNHSTDGTINILEGYIDSRLKIIRPEFELPMASHYEFAINQALGEWITILGDDDAVMPYIFDALDGYIINYQNVDIISSARAYYFWDGCRDIYGDIVVKYSLISKSSIRSARKDLYAALAGIRSCFDLPQIYTTSIIKRSLYEAVKLKSGGIFFHSIIPDMYSAVAFCLFRESYLRVDEPLFWVGTSNMSMSRSDRVYRDAKLLANPESACQIKKISSDVSYELHLNGFGPLYLYECLLQTPLKNEVHSGHVLRAIVLAAVLKDIRSRQRCKQKDLFQELCNECNRYSIPINVVIFISFCLRLLSLISRVQAIIKIIIYRLHNYSKNSLNIRSDNREKFNNILLASSEVMRCRDKFKK